MRCFSLLLLFFSAALVSSTLRAEIIVPGNTAYGLPDADAIQLEKDRGVVGWKDPSQRVGWYGNIAKPGELAVSVRLLTVGPTGTKLRLQVGEVAHEVTVPAAKKAQTASFGTFTIKAEGYVAITVESLNPPGNDAGELQALVLSGPAAEGAHFNLLERRNAASVHLAYPTPKDAKVAMFYTEVTAAEDPVYTFYMACGFSRGYLGMQVNSPTERRLIFSIWDSGSGQNANNRKEVSEEHQTKLLAKGEGVEASIFGGEGTGGHSHLVYPWKTGEAQKFVVTAQPAEGRTTYAGYWYHPEKKAWLLLARFLAPHDGNYLQGLHSFSENFGGSNGHLLRKARYGPQWIADPQGKWQELLTATFSHDGTGQADRLDRFMGVEEGKFFLSHGGFVAGFTKFGEPFTRPATAPPSTLVLP